MQMEDIDRSIDIGPSLAIYRFRRPLPSTPSAPREFQLLELLDEFVCEFWIKIATFGRNNCICFWKQDKSKLNSLVNSSIYSLFIKMENDKGENVELYVPRKW